jgi:hypothetical protein
MKKTALLVLFVITIQSAYSDGLCDPHIKSYEVKYDQYQNAINLAQERNKLLGEIRSWQKFMGREVGQIQYRKSKIESFLKFSLKHDRPVLAKEHFQAVSNEVQLAYHIIKKNRKLSEELTFLIERNPNHPDINSLRKTLADIHVENLKQAKTIARKIDEYSATFNTLEAIAKGTDKSAENARWVLDKLQSQYILDNFFKDAQILERETPAVKDLFAILDEFAEADIYHLKLAKRMEMYSALLSISPSESFFRYLDKMMVKVPWINKSKFRAFIAEVQDSRLHALYYSDIERVLMTETIATERLDLLISVASTYDKGFLVTFSRRVDAKDIWKQLKEAAAERDTEFLEQMLKAEEEGKNLSRLSILKDNTTSKIVMRFIDLMFASAIGYGTVSYFEDEGIIKSKEAVSKLTDLEEKELDDYLELSGQALQEMKKDGVK